MSSDVVGRWTVSLADGIHKIEFEHGTVSGKRVIRVDGKVRFFFLTFFLFFFLLFYDVIKLLGL